MLIGVHKITYKRNYFFLPVLYELSHFYLKFLRSNIMVFLLICKIFFLLKLIKKLTVAIDQANLHYELVAKQ